MYSKANYRENGDLIIPDNYNGNAFGGGLIAREDLPDEQVSEALKSDEATPDEREEGSVTAKSDRGSFLSSLLPPKISKPSGVLSNVGLEEMLIIGILILLSQGDGDDDILLLLFLLLFYK